MNKIEEALDGDWGINYLKKMTGRIIRTLEQMQQRKIPANAHVIGGILHSADHIIKCTEVIDSALTALRSGELVVTDTTEETEDQRIIREAYHFEVDYDGFLWGLTAGDHGFEKTSIKCVADGAVLVDRQRLITQIKYALKNEAILHGFVDFDVSDADIENKIAYLQRKDGE